ncbi:MAG: ATP-dependent zinc metalloprotease FtsH [Pelolinea sp.]|nr:ATP-dependent zinc metalloprotease FtsH [Pelolinea sp.]
MKSSNQTNFVYLLILISIVAMIFMNINRDGAQNVMTINEVATEIKNGNVTKIVQDEDTLTITLSDGEQNISTKETGTALIDQLIAYGVPNEALDSEVISIEIQQPSQWVNILSFLGYVLPFLIVGAAFFFIFRQAQGSNNAAMSFGKSKARMFTGDQPKVTFADVAGADESKEELQEVVEFLKEPQKFISLGARIPKGVLLVGPPGGGKTLLAKAVSGEAGVPFFSISGSEFVEMFVGVGASRVRDLFEQAKKHSPCIIFIDEIDAVGRHRGAGLGGSHDEREQTLNQMLVEMDGFDTDTNVIVIAATNRPDILDPALLRPGRFDRRVVLDRPDMRGREEILQVHIKGKPIAPDVDLKVLAKSTPGFVGADIENLINEGAILAARKDKKQIGQKDFEEAILRVIAGPERKSRLISEGEKQIIAYHEAGHAIVMASLAEADQVQKISIISRGMAAGFTLALPENDQTLVSKNKMIAEMIGLLGGRASEEVVFNDITSGAANDIERVTQLARNMVTRFGMSQDLGPLVYGKKDELVFLGKDIREQRDYSEAIAEKIDDEVYELVNNAYLRAKKIIVKYRKKLDAVAGRLLEVETISKKEFDKIFPPPVEKNSGVPIIVV